MPQKPEKDFNEKAMPAAKAVDKGGPKPSEKSAKAWTYSVSVAEKVRDRKKADFSTAVDRAVREIEKLARREKAFDQVKITVDDGAFKKLGIFFVQAPEKMAALIARIDGVASVEKSGSSKSTRKTIPSGLRRPRK